MLQNLAQQTPATSASGGRQASIKPITTMSDAFLSMTDLCTANSHEYFLIGHPPDVGTHAAAGDVLLSNLPLYLINDLVARDLLSKWSLIARFRQTSAPFGYELDGQTGDQASPLQLVRQDQIPDGGPPVSVADGLLVEELSVTSVQCLPAANRGPRRAFLALFSTSDDKSVLNPAAFVAFQHIFDCIESLPGQGQYNPSSELTSRELECLNWVAAGKTSGEIATIVGLSEHTVNHYLISCCKKLDSVNRTQAVAKALRSRLIQ